MAGKYFIPNLGVSQSVLENKGNNPLDKLMFDLTLDICDQLREQLKQRDINTTSLGLSQSIRPTEATIQGKQLTVGILAEEYWKYVNFGVNGTNVNHGAPNWGSRARPTVQDIEEWIPKRGIQPYGTLKGAAIAITRKVIRDGKEARPFYDAVINDKLINFMRPQVEELLGRAIEINIVSKWQ